MSPEQMRALALARVRARLRQNQEDRQRARPGLVGTASRVATPAPNNAQRQEVGRMAAQRNMQRNIGLPGLSTAVQPFINMVRSPERREEFGRSMQGAWNDIQSLPSLDWGRIGRETTDNISNAVRPENLARTGGALVQHIPQIAAELTGVPALQREEQAMQRLDMARVQGDEGAASLAARQANTETGQFGATVAAPLLGGGSQQAASSPAWAQTAAYPLPAALAACSSQLKQL